VPVVKVQLERAHAAQKLEITVDVLPE